MFNLKLSGKCIHHLTWYCGKCAYSRQAWICGIIKDTKNNITIDRWFYMLMLMFGETGWYLRGLLLLGCHCKNPIHYTVQKRMTTCVWVNCTLSYVTSHMHKRHSYQYEICNTNNYFIFTNNRYKKCNFPKFNEKLIG